MKGVVMRKFLSGLFIDLIAFAGLAMVGVGLWMVQPWLSLVIIGMVLFISGIIGTIGANK